MTFLTILLDSPILSSLAKTLLHFLWQGTLIALVLYLVLNALQKSKSELRYLCALMSLVACVIAPIVTFFWFYQPEITILLTEPILPEQSLETASTNSLLTYLNWDFALSLTGLLWIAGVFYLSVHLILELFNVYQLSHQNLVQPDPEIIQIFDRLAKQLQVNRLTQLVISLEAEVPLVVGFLKPVVLLPLSMSSGLTLAQLEMLLAHELAHVKRHDYLVNFLQTLVEITLFFHPLVKWMSMQIRIEREYCCDDIAIHSCGNVLAYATALTDAESIRGENIPQLAMAATAGDLKNRILRIVDRTDCTNKFTRSWHSMALAALVGVTLPVMLFSAHAAYQHRVEETFNPKIHEQQDGEVVINFVTIKAESAPTFAQTTEQSKNKNRSKNRSKNRDQALSQTNSSALSQTNSSALSQTNSLALSQTNSLALNQTNRQTLNQTKSRANQLAQTEELQHVIHDTPSTQKLITEIDNQAIGDAKLITAVKLVAVPIPQSVVEVPESSVEQTLELQQQITAQNKLAEQLKLPQKLDLVDVELPKVQIESHEQLVTIIAPTLVRNARPNYPRMAVAKRAEAEVKVSFTVDVDGTISKLSFDNHVPGYFKRSVRRALREWRFDPGSIDGEIAAIRLSRIFIFSDPLGDVEGSTRLKVTGSRIYKQT